MQKWAISQGPSFDKILHAIIDCTHREKELFPRTSPLIGSAIQIGQTALKSHSNKPQYKWTQQIVFIVYAYTCNNNNNKECFNLRGREVRHGRGEKADREVQEVT